MESQPGAGSDGGGGARAGRGGRQVRRDGPGRCGGEGSGGPMIRRVRRIRGVPHRGRPPSALR
ncbi:hypothetical protein FM110_08575 [Brachybacterium nesterenkovii]|uniref:Uncharacterized protein n=1 Tax=Brachybacterium nesterenkovii TaxID=47847 RepID=A0A1X6X243_9MICO|nr:hypothetical protein FM110_08575 [Brachybacterium nesterenkovii]